MKKITITIEEVQDKDIKDIQKELVITKDKMLNYSAVVRLVLDEGLKKFPK